LTVSEQAEQISGEAGSPSGEPVVVPSSDASVEPTAAGEHQPMSAESPALVPDQGAAGAAPEVNVPKADAPKADTPKADFPRAVLSKADTSKPGAPHIPARVMIMSSADHGWDGDNAGPKVEPEQNREMFGKRRLSAVAAVVALAAIAGALGGAVATVGLQRFAANDVAPAGNPALEASVARIDADIQALKAGVEHSSKLGMAQFNKTSERLDKVEKAQAEPAAKLAKLSEAVDKLRATPAPAASVAVAAKDVTGSIPLPVPAPKVEVARLPTVEGWLLRDVGNGGALVEGRQGIFEVYAGDPLPGLGRVDAIRRQDGRWVVVTTKGLIVAR
jgi:hypothetical protein